jgi:hypothetical protein
MRINRLGKVFNEFTVEIENAVVTLYGFFSGFPLAESSNFFEQEEVTK